MDNSPDLGRKVRLVAVSTGEKSMMDLLLSKDAKKRRRWVVTGWSGHSVEGKVR